MKLEEECRSCSGTGNYYEYGPPGSSRGSLRGRRYPKQGDAIVFSVKGGCPCCQGTGYSLTEFGEEIMDMVRRHLNAKPQPIPGESQ